MGRSESGKRLIKSEKQLTDNIRNTLDMLIDPAFDKIIFTLSPRLGGRSEVLETPILEALSYLDMERKEKESEKLERFHYLYFGANSKVDGKARKQFYDKIKPKEAGRKILGNSGKKMDWNYAQMDEFRAKT